jgi:predicted PurR-regulated permease PerM
MEEKKITGQFSRPRKVYKPSAHPTSPPWSPAFKLTVGIITFLAFVLVMYTARIVFIPLIIGAIIAYLIYPLVRQVSSETRLPHGWATGFVFIILLATLIPIILLMVPLLTTQFENVRNQLLTVVTEIQQSSTNVITIVPGVEIEVQQLIDEASTSLTTAISSLAVRSPAILLDASKGLLLIIVTLLVAFYLTADAQKVVSWLKYIAPPGYRHDVDMLLFDINGIWQDFFRGQVLVALVAGILNTLIAFAIGLPEPLLMGVLALFLEFLVSVGHTIWLMIALALALTQGSTWLPVSPLVFALIVLGSNLIFTKVDLNIVIPRIVGERMHLHPMVVLIGIIMGAAVGGVLGIALAAPTIATLRVLGRYSRAKLFDLDPYEEVAAINPTGEPARVPTKPIMADDPPPAK